MHSYNPDDLHGAPASVLDSRASSFIDMDPSTGQYTAAASIYHDSILAPRFDPVKLQAKIKAFEDDRSHRRTLGPDDFDYTRLRQIPPAEAINQAPLIDDFGISDADYPLWWWEINWHPKPKSKSIAYRKHRLACFLAMLEDRDRRATRLLSLNLLAITSMLWLQSKRAPLETHVTVTRHILRYRYAVTTSTVTVTSLATRYRYAVTTPSVTVTSHTTRNRYAVTTPSVIVTSRTIRYCYAVTTSPLCLAYAPKAQANRVPWRPSSFLPGTNAFIDRW